MGSGCQLVNPGRTAIWTLPRSRCMAGHFHCAVSPRIRAIERHLRIGALGVIASVIFGAGLSAGPADERPTAPPTAKPAPVESVDPTANALLPEVKWSENPPSALERSVIRRVVLGMLAESSARKPVPAWFGL